MAAQIVLAVHGLAAGGLQLNDADCALARGNDEALLRVGGDDLAGLTGALRHLSPQELQPSAGDGRGAAG